MPDPMRGRCRRCRRRGHRTTACDVPCDRDVTQGGVTRRCRHGGIYRMTDGRRWLNVCGIHSRPLERSGGWRHATLDELDDPANATALPEVRPVRPGPWAAVPEHVHAAAVMALRASGQSSVADQLDGKVVRYEPDNHHNAELCPYCNARPS